MSDSLRRGVGVKGVKSSHSGSDTEVSAANNISTRHLGGAASGGLPGASVGGRQLLAGSAAAAGPCLSWAGERRRTHRPRLRRWGAHLSGCSSSSSCYVNAISCCCSSVRRHRPRRRRPGLRLASAAGSCAPSALLPLLRGRPWQIPAPVRGMCSPSCSRLGGEGPARVAARPFPAEGQLPNASSSPRAPSVGVRRTCGRASPLSRG